MHSTKVCAGERQRYLGLLGAIFLALALAVGMVSPRTAHSRDLSVQPGQVVIQVWVDDTVQLDWLRDNFDVWTRDRDTGAWWVRLQSSQLSRLQALKLNYQIDAARTAELYAPTPVQQLGADTISGFACYRTVEKSLTDIAALAGQFPDLAEVRDIGDSWQKTNNNGGHDILALVLTNRNLNGPKPPLMIIAAMHAREYATAELALRFGERLLNDYGSDADATWLLDEFEIHLIPQLNPDGRAIAEVFDTRFKRKNDDEAFCPGDGLTGRGIDLNRNSTVLWGGTGSSSNACSDTFRGDTPVSEPETQAIEAYMANIFNDQRPGAADNLSTPAPDTSEGIFISIHSFSELVLFPWEGITTNSGNHAGLRSLSRKLAFFNNYAACQDCLGSTAGTTVDTAYGEYGVAAMTFEIGTSFFQSCSSFDAEILPDNLDALMFAAKSTRRPYRAPAAPEVTNPTLSTNTADAGTVVILSAQIDDQRRRLVSDDGGEPADQADPIVAAYYTIGAPQWAGAPLIPMQAADGLFDSATETAQISIDTSQLPLGRNLLFVYGEDNSGLGAPSAVFLEVVQSEQIFNDGFETTP